MNQKHPFHTLSAILLAALLGWGAYPNTVKADSWSFVVVGDQRDEGSYGINQPIVAAMANHISLLNPAPAFVLCGGDQIHGVFNPTEAPLPDQYNHWLAAMTPILSNSYPVRGNHETHGDEGNGHPYAYYWQTYMVGNMPQIPQNGPPNEVGMSYSFHNKNVFIIGLEESYTTSWYQVNQTWLNKQLAANKLPFTFVYGHYPAFGFAETLEPGSLADHPTQRNAFWKSLGDSSVNIYFAGHVHSYNRAEISIDGGPEIQQIVVGTGGAPLTTWDGKYSDPRVIGESHLEHRYGYSLVTVDGNKITVVFYAYDQTANTWTPFDTYSYTMTSRNFGANDANQSLDPDTLTNYYQGIGLNKIGAGTLTLTAGATTYSDPITVSAGALTVDGDYSSVPVTIQSGGTVNLDAGALVGGVDVNSGGTLNGSGTVVGTLSNSGVVNLQTGNFSVATAYLNAGGLFNQTRGTLDFTTFNQSGGTGTFTDLFLGRNAGSSSTYNLSAGSVTATNAYVGFSGTGTFTQSGGTHTVNGNLILAANPGSSGTYNLQGGSLTAGTITVNTGGFFNQTGGSMNAPITLAGGTVASGTDNGLGNQTLTINSGTLQAANGTTPTLGNPISVGGDFTLGGANNLTLSGAVGLGGATHTLTVTNSGNTTLSGIISNGGLNINNTGGTLNLAGANAYAGGTTLNSGTLLIGSNSALGSGGLTISGGTFGANAVGISATNAITVGGSFNLGTSVGNGLSLSSDLALGGNNLTHTGAGADTLSGKVSGSGAITINAGTLNLAGANTYSSDTILNAGTLLAGSNSAFSTGGLTINGGAIGASAPNITVGNLLTIGSNFNMGGPAGTNLELTKDLNLGTYTLTHNGAGNDTLSAKLTSTGGITVTAGTLNLTGNNAAYAGTSTVTGGALNLQGTGNYTGTNTVSGGTLNMSSAGSTYSGASTVMGGTLNLSAGTLSGILTLNGGTFTLSGTGAYMNPAPLSNSAGTTLNIVTGSTLTLAGGLTNSGNTGVNGTLTGNLTNNAGGLVNGSGVITGALVNNGTVNSGNSPGTLTVGTYTAAAGSTQVVEIASASSYDKIVTTAAGGATLNGGTVSPRLLRGFLPSTNQVFNIIQTTGGGTVTGAFNSIDNTRVGDSRTLFWQLNYYPSNVDLQAVGNYTPADLSLSRNQRSVGNMLNGVAPSATSGDLFEVLNAINALTTDQAVSRAYDEISPQKYAALPTLAFPVTHMQFQYLQNRLARQRWEAELGSDAVSSGGGGFMRGFNFAYDNNKMLLASSTFTVSDGGNPLIRKGVDHRWGIYLEPMANWGNLRPTANMLGYRYKNFGFTLGADYWVMDNLLVGVNTGYSKTLTGIGGTGGNINANIIPFNAYSSFFIKSFYVNGTLGYTFSNYDMERNVAFGTLNRTAKANTSGNQFQAAAETGYDFKVGNAIVGPTVSLQYATQTTGGFNESNAGALNLKVGSQTADSLQTGVGARASYRAKVGNVTVKPQLSVVWQHEYSNNTRGVNARLAQGSSTMNFRTDKIGQNFAVVSFDLPARVTKNLVVHAGYTAEVGRGKSSNQGVNLGLKYEF